MRNLKNLNRQTVDSKGLVDGQSNKLICRIDWQRDGNVRLYTGTDSGWSCGSVTSCIGCGTVRGMPDAIVITWPPAGAG